MTIELEVHLCNGEHYRGKPIPTVLFPDEPSVAIRENEARQREWMWEDISSVTVHDTDEE